MFGGRGGIEDFGGGVFPGYGFIGGLEEVLGILGEETHIDEDADEFGKALVAQGATYYGAGFGNGVLFFERGRVSVGVGDEGKACVASRVRFRGGHEPFAGNFASLAILKESGIIA